MKQRIIYQNPVALAEIPKSEKTSIQTWTEDEVKKILLHSQNSRYHTGFVLAITTGMRLGEVLGLRWQGVDFDNHTVTINQTLGHDNKIKTSTKTYSSKRTIPIPLEAIEELKKRRLQVNKEKLRLGTAYLLKCSCFRAIVTFMLFIKRLLYHNLQLLALHYI
ncbi:hypothetical protein BWGOE8_23230 [Bacillus mycoides]|uniref:Site-specific integrase n=2 Tax=Bacillus cereus group TaxID=86661 RepID=A0A2C1CTD0_BACCE|nr:hypothetical protein BWGOE9_23280 [Bacillus mycoides]OFD79900.1 hypothetical protein BWGOE8_23230 [Bacillus mycoides]OFD81035.1 hypothetical protein BWGOE10_25780 [Bacillus mycoides]PGS91386.1 site-specific integrase [Bacillus cereus]